MNGSIFWRNGTDDVKAWFGLFDDELKQETTSTLIVDDVSHIHSFL